MDITEYFYQLIEDFRSSREAIDAFDRQLDSDPEMAAEFEAWCNENGYRRRSVALRELAEEYIERRESVWDSLKDYDNEYE